MTSGRLTRNGGAVTRDTPILTAGMHDRLRGGAMLIFMSDENRIAGPTIWMAWLPWGFCGEYVDWHERDWAIKAGYCGA